MKLTTLKYRVVEAAYDNTVTEVAVTPMRLVHMHAIKSAPNEANEKELRTGEIRVEVNTVKSTLRHLGIDKVLSHFFFPGDPRRVR